MYTPTASPPTKDGLEFWKALQSAVKNPQEKSKLYKTWVEVDLYDNILDTVHGSIATLGPNVSFEMLRDVSERSMLPVISFSLHVRLTVSLR